MPEDNVLTGWGYQLRSMVIDRSYRMQTCNRGLSWSRTSDWRHYQFLYLVSTICHWTHVLYDGKLQMICWPWDYSW